MDMCFEKDMQSGSDTRQVFFMCIRSQRFMHPAYIYMYVYIKHVCAVHYIVIHSQIEIIYKFQWTVHFTSNGTEIEKYAPTA